MTNQAISRGVKRAIQRSTRGHRFHLINENVGAPISAAEKAIGISDLSHKLEANALTIEQEIDLYNYSCGLVAAGHDVIADAAVERPELCSTPGFRRYVERIAQAQRINAEWAAELKERGAQELCDGQDAVK